MKNFSFFKDLKKTFIIAEIGNNHEGSFANAKKLILEAAKAKVDAVKFQTCEPEKFISNLDVERIKKLNRVKFSKEQILKLQKYAKKKGIIFFSTPLDFSSAKLLKGICPIIKIASCDNDYLDLIYEVLTYKVPIIISTGLVDIKYLKSLEKKLIYKFKNKNPQLAFLHCISSYPAKKSEVNLNVINEMKKSLKHSVIGYSDHTKGIQACVYAVAAGARIIEKHFTLDKKFSKNFDHHLSANPKEMKKLVNKIRDLEIYLGQSKKSIVSSEKKNIKILRRSVFYVKNLKSNHFIKKDDLIMKRPGIGLAYKDIQNIINKKLLKNVMKDQLVNFKDFK